MNWWRWKPTPFKWVLIALFLGSVGVALARLFLGLGAVTNLSDNTPWGIWKAFDVIMVVPLGASGFTLAFVRYFLKAESYEHIARRSVIWAAIAYLSMGARLAFDIGLPWRLPYPLVFWGNIHSALFEVAWCVALYLIVLFMENAPRLLDIHRTPWLEKAEHVAHKIIPIFVLGGVMLSTLHQSSLGTLYMIAGRRMDALWYHPWLNYLYLLTAIACGLAVAILIEGWSNQYYGTKFENGLLCKLAGAAAIALSLTLVWRIGFLAADGNLGLIFAARSATFWWWAEILVGYLVPIALWAAPSLRVSRWPLLIGAAGTVAGMMLFRGNVVFTAMNKAMGSNYFPSLTELLFTVGATAGTMVIYTWFVETMPSMLGKEAQVQAADD